MPTIKDVAKLAGVGVGTVSRVVAGKGPVAAETAARVRKAIDELGYRPSHAARSLLTGRSQTIGVFLPLIKGSFYTPILHSIYSALRAGGRHMVVVFGQSLEDERVQALEGAQFLIDRGCDGLILMGSALHREDLEALTAKQPRFVILNRRFEGFEDQCFYPDHEAAGRAAGRTLCEAGHRRFAVISGPATSTDNAARMKGFLDELTAHGVDAGAIEIVENDFSPEGGWTSTEALMASGRPFTALFCANDEMALGALSYLHEAGVSVPGRISVMGYDGTDVSTFSAPRLTTVHIPWRELAVDGLSHLLNQCYDAGLPVRRDHPVEVIWRASVARPAD